METKNNNEHKMWFSKHKKAIGGLAALVLATVIGSYISCKNREEQTVQTEIEETIAVEQDKEEQIVQTESEMMAEIEKMIADKYDFQKKVSNIKIIIPAGKGYDIDSIRLSSGPDADIFFSRIKRNLYLVNTARFIYLGRVNFNAVTLEDLTSPLQRYSPGIVREVDDDTLLLPNSVIGIKTEQGNYVKLRIDGPITPNYDDLQCTLFIFPKETNPTDDFF